MELCQQHLENLVIMNEDVAIYVMQLDAELNRFLEEDEFIKAVITAKRKLNAPAYTSTRTSRRTR